MIIISDFISILNWFRKSKETNRKGSDVLCHVRARGNQDAGRLEERRKPYKMPEPGAIFGGKERREPI